MDPISQGVVGAIASQTFANKNNIKIATVIGYLSGMSADLDIFFRSPSDPLLGLILHRHFTHSLLFIPIATVLSLLCYRWFKDKISKRQFLLFFFLGYATHGFLDIMTSYGTNFIWPFSNMRVAFDIFPIIDLFFTVPLLVFIILRCVMKRRSFTWAALTWITSYTVISTVQHQRAINVIENKIGATSQKYRCMPTISNLVLYRGVAIVGDEIKIYGIHVPLFGDAKVVGSSVVNRYINDKVNPNSVLGDDIKTFIHFTDDFAGVDDTGFVFDARYAMLPQSKEPLWGIKLPDRDDQHCEFIHPNKRSMKSFLDFLSLLAD